MPEPVTTAAESAEQHRHWLWLFAELLDFAEKDVSPHALAQFGMRFRRSDVVSEAWIKAQKTRKLESLPEEQRRPYLRTILASKRREMVRHQLADCRNPAREQPIDAPPAGSGAAPSLPGREDDPSARLAEQERNARLEEALKLLPEREREVITLRQYQGLKLREVAARLGCTTAEAARLHARALKRLRVSLRDLGDPQ